jgi:hypothetical protein
LSFREGLFWGTLGAALAAAAAALRVASWGVAFSVLFGSAALVVAPAVAGLARAQPLSPWVRSLLVGLGLAGPLLAKLASALMVATHHRPLGAVTFAAFAVVIVLGLSLAAARVFALAAAGLAFARWLARALLVLALASALLLFVRGLVQTDVARGLFDLALALGTSALLRLPPWPPTLTPKLAAFGVPVWILAVALALGTGLLAGFEPARSASPALSAPITCLFP